MCGFTKTVNPNILTLSGCWVNNGKHIDSVRCIKCDFSDQHFVGIKVLNYYVYSMVFLSIVHDIPLIYRLFAVYILLPLIECVYAGQENYVHSQSIKIKDLLGLN